MNRDWLRATSGHAARSPASASAGGAASPTAAGRRPDICDRCRAGRAARVAEAVHVLDRAQHAVVVDRLAVASRRDPGPHEDRRDLIVAAIVVVLVPGQDEEAVVGLGPLVVAVEVGL